jgi:hypothetical protein
MKNATAMSHGSTRLLEAPSEGCDEGVPIGSGRLKFVGPGCIGLRARVRESQFREKPIIAERGIYFIKTDGGSRANFSLRRLIAGILNKGSIQIRVRQRNVADAGSSAPPATRLIRASLL